MGRIISSHTFCVQCASQSETSQQKVQSYSPTNTKPQKNHGPKPTVVINNTNNFVVLRIL